MKPKFKRLYFVWWGEWIGFGLWKYPRLWTRPIFRSLKCGYLEIRIFMKDARPNTEIRSE